MGDRAREDRGLDRPRFAVGDGEIFGVVERQIGEKKRGPGRDLLEANGHRLPSAGAVVGPLDSERGAGDGEGRPVTP